MKKNEKKIQNGRSMIEMLGVLAVIGVLSVGGIAGYSKAMMNYRINKTIEQISISASNIRAFISRQRKGSLNNTILKKANLVPEEMWIDSGDVSKGLSNVFGGTYGISAQTGISDAGVPCGRGIWISLNLIPEEACIALVTHDWHEAQVKSIGVTNYEQGGRNDFKSFDDLDRAVTACHTENGILGVGDYIEFEFEI